MAGRLTTGGACNNYSAMKYIGWRMVGEIDNTLDIKSRRLLKSVLEKQYKRVVHIMLHMLHYMKIY